MEKSISKAFTYMFKDNDWQYKIFILLLLTTPLSVMGFFQVLMFPNGKMPDGAAITYFIVLIIISVLFSFISLGYYAKCANNIIYSNEKSTNSDLLPKWENDFAQFPKLGLKFFLAGIFPYIAICLVLGVFILLIPILGSIIALIMILIYSYFATALAAIFYSDYNIYSFFKLKEGRKLVSYDEKKYLQILFLMFILSLLYGIVPALFVKPFLIVLVMPIIQVYGFLVSIYLSAILFPTEPEVFFGTD